MKLESYWLDTAPPFTAGAPGPFEGRVDALVIGAGFTGLSAAQALAQRGATVALAEATRIGALASGRNGGQCNGGLAHDYGPLVERFGLGTVRLWHRAYCDAVDSVERLVREESIECGFTRHGRLKLAAKPRHYPGLVQTCERMLRDFDPDYRLIPPEAIRGEVDSPLFHGGMLHTRSAQLHVGEFAIGLAHAAARRGARIYENAPVTALERLPGGGFRASTPRGTLEAAQVLVATGSTDIGPFGWFRRRMAPVGSFIIVTEPLGAAVLDRLLPQGRSYVTSRVIGNYFRRTPDQRLLFGGRARFAVSSPRADAHCGEILRATMARTFPELAGARIDYVWGGSVDMTIDRLPRAGEHDGMHYAMGYSGHGTQMSVHMGQVMARVMAGETEANPWRQLHWSAIPGHTGSPWFMPVVGSWYRLLDLIH
ncbi:MAG: FAD-binding oxidoreductase [Steroidobacteraceae bacterium]